jgi:hypothetical protein
VSGAQQPHSPSAETVFVRAVDLPTASLVKARDAIELQLDILSPLPADAVVASVVMLGPADSGLTRFAVGFAARSLFDNDAAAGASGPAAIRLTGRLDGEELEFRFENPYRADARAQRDRSRLVLATSALAALAMMAGAVSLRLGGDIDTMQQRLDAAEAAVQRSIRLHTTQGEARTAWAATGAAHNARLVNCAFTALAKGAAGRVYLTSFAVDGGVATASFSRPLDPAAVTAITGGAAVSGYADPTAVRQTQLDGSHCR